GVSPCHRLQHPAEPGPVRGGAARPPPAGPPGRRDLVDPGGLASRGGQDDAPSRSHPDAEPRRARGRADAPAGRRRRRAGRVGRAGGAWWALVDPPPGAGTTTLLRGLIRTLSGGAPAYGLKPQRVGVADERGELAGAFRGVAQNDLGPRADVIDRCPKRFALAMLVRTMSPGVVVTDESGRPEDPDAALDAVTAGLALVRPA